jgi:hypothetical protein
MKQIPMAIVPVGLIRSYDRPEKSLKGLIILFYKLNNLIAKIQAELKAPKMDS